MRKTSMTLLATLVLSLAAGAAKADSVFNYSVSNATFDNSNGTPIPYSLSGTWQFDATTLQVTAMNLVVANFNGQTWANYTITQPVNVAASAGNGSNTYALNVPGVSTVGNSNLLFNFNSANGSPLVPNSNFSNDYTRISTQQGYSYLANAGTFTAPMPVPPAPVPEPASAVLMMSGLGVVGMVVRRRRALHDADSNLVTA